MIKAILFDFGQTLVDSADGFRTAEKEAQAKIFSTLEGWAWEEFKSLYRRVRSEYHAVSRFSRKAVWEEVFDRLGRRADPDRLEAWEDEYWERVKALTRPFPETERVLGYLQDRYSLGMVTNTQGQKTTGTHRLSQFPALEKYFEVIIVAGEAGMPPKPDPAPFLRCLRDLGVVPEEAVFVGDDWRIDISGAEGAGIRAVWLKHHSVRRNWPEVETKAPIITSLDQLPGLKLLSEN